MQSDSLKTENYFQRRARQFDALYSDECSWQYFLNHLFRRPLYERVHRTIDAFADLRDFTVLDVGCGSGRNSVVFAQNGARRVVGIDFSANMIAMARECARRHGISDRCEFIFGDALTHPFREKFDVVTALGVFDYIRKPLALLRRMNELASKKIVASFPGWSPLRAPLRKARYWLRDCPVYFSTRDRLHQVCADAGLEDYQLLPVSGRAGWVLVARAVGRRSLAAREQRKCTAC
ncbi:MAG: class I SAM-dependent methyltransferase [Candidatus Acidiferrales bacterium]